VQRNAAHVSVLNASLSIPGYEERVKQHAQEGRIPGAIFFDLDKVGLEEKQFGVVMDRIGVH
jgi:3-mercaptopyruvate sulfurtransferase SseA